MILVTRLNGTKVYLNPELIRMVEQTPDTVITLVDDKKMVVKESPEELTQRFIEYQRSIHRPKGLDVPEGKGVDQS